MSNSDVYTLAALLEELPSLRAKLMGEGFLTAIYRYYFMAQDEAGNSRRMHLTEADFLGESDGWPKHGTYQFEVWVDGTCVYQLEAHHVAMMPAVYRSPVRSGPDANDRSHIAMYERLEQEIARVRREADQAKVRENGMRKEMDGLADALSLQKKKTLAHEVQRDNAVLAQERAELERDVAVREREEMVRRGGQFAPLLETTIDAGVDRIFVNMGVPQQGLRGRMQDAMREIAEAVVTHQGAREALLKAGIIQRADVELLLAVIAAQEAKEGASEDEDDDDDEEENAA